MKNDEGTIVEGNEDDIKKCIKLFTETVGKQFIKMRCSNGLSMCRM